MFVQDHELLSIETFHCPVLSYLFPGVSVEGWLSVSLSISKVLLYEPCVVSMSAYSWLVNSSTWSTV